MIYVQGVAHIAHVLPCKPSNLSTVRTTGKKLRVDVGSSLTTVADAVSAGCPSRSRF